MNRLLLNNKPTGATEQDFKASWNNNSYCLEALWKTIDQLILENNGVNKSDFDCPNHYAKLAYQAGMTKAYETIISMLPESAKPN